MVIGHGCMAVERLFLVGLVLTAVGNGGFKPNVSAQLSTLYEAPGPTRLRDRGFAIFYSGSACAPRQRSRHPCPICNPLHPAVSVPVLREYELTLQACARCGSAFHLVSQSTLAQQLHRSCAAPCSSRMALRPHSAPPALACSSGLRHTWAACTSWCRERGLHSVSHPMHRQSCARQCVTVQVRNASPPRRAARNRSGRAVR